ncbi:hypothetical protein [Rubellicoccus peritrichatus]|uniref:Uncharacterized protein n=1 Tax=Rubellicoccus peritrichatus TaxID=3080537 RepID=A0AAQ3QXV4_9BACT|nr:hypothetical protein [Puniceicoccus sp. CR14]WOO43442.1 hypothetical protein RZN69_10110 [Puniceicoccus sp. CR14]
MASKTLPLIAYIICCATLPVSTATAQTGDQDTPYTYSRYGDFKSAQLRSTSTHGYGLYAVEMQMSYSQSVSTFWLYGDRPSTIYMEDVAQLWRWNEIDFEFVPFTESKQAEYFTFSWDGTQPLVPNYNAAVLELSSVLAHTPGADSSQHSVWQTNLIRTDEQVAQQTMNAAAVGLTYTNGAPTGGTFQIVVESGGQTVTSGDIAYNASATDVNNALTAMSDGNAFLSTILTSGFVVNPAGPAGASSSTTKDSTTITVPAGTLAQISPGDAVTEPGATKQNPSIIPSGTTVVSVDRTANTVTVNNAPTATNGSVFLDFTPASTWIVAFNGGVTIAPDAMPNIYLDLSKLTPAGTTLGTIVPGLTPAPANDATSLTVRVFQTPLSPANGQTWLQYLAANTGEGKTYGDSTQWKYPITTLSTPADFPMDQMGSVNFWRMPVGDESKSLDFTSSDYGIFDRTGIYRGALAKATDNTFFTSEPLNNEAFFWDRTLSYNPYTAIYTYVIAWTPTRMAQYLLPKMERDDNGLLPVIDIDNITPLVEYDLANYASLAQSGPQADPTTNGTPGGEKVFGGTVPFAYTELAEQIDNVSINLANYVAYSQASDGINSSATVNATVAAGSLTVTDVNSFSANVTTTKGRLLATLTGVGANTVEKTMFITSDNTSLIPAATWVREVWNDAYLVTLTTPATATGTGSFTFTQGESVFTVTGKTFTGTNDLVVNGLNGNTITAGMTIAASPSGLLPPGDTVASVSAKETVIELNQTPPGTGSDIAYLFNIVTTADNEMVSWLPQAGQLVSGTGIPEGASIASVSTNGSSFTLKTANSKTPTSSISSITLATPEATPGWSGPPPPRGLADSSAYVRSVGFFELKDPTSDGSKTSDYNIAQPSASNDNFWVDFSDTRFWTIEDWKTQITRHFNLGFTNNFTHLGAQPGLSLQYPNISPANIGLTTLGNDQVLELKVGANDLTLDVAGTGWKTPPNMDFYQISANSPTGQVSSSDELLRVEVYRTDSPEGARTHWTANTPALGPTFIFPPYPGETFDLTVNLWVLESGTLSNGASLPAPGHTATLTLSNDATTGPTFKVKSDKDKIIATTPGRIIQVQKPSKGTTTSGHFVTSDYGFYLAQPELDLVRDDHPKVKGTIRHEGASPWYFSEQYGHVYAGAQPWVFSLDFAAWLYPQPDEDGNIWLWSEHFGWSWANAYPFFYSIDDDGWYFIDTSSFVYDVDSGEWKFITQLR